MSLSNLTIYSVWLETICLCAGIPFIKDKKIIGFSDFFFSTSDFLIFCMTGYLLSWFYYFCHYLKSLTKNNSGKKGLMSAHGSRL